MSSLPEATPSPDQPTSAPATRRGTKWGKRLGWLAFTFFLIKGLAWLIVPATLAVLATR